MVAEDMLSTAIAAVSAGVAIRLIISKVTLRFRIVAVVDGEVRGSATSDCTEELPAKGITRPAIRRKPDAEIED